MNYIGMDIHKQFTFAVAKDEQGTIIATEKFSNEKDTFQQFLQAFPPADTKIVIESTSVWEYIYEILESMQYQVKLANPVRTRAIAAARIKTDSVDAATLADLLRSNFIAESYIPPKSVRKLRELTRERRTLVQQTTQIKNRIHAILIRRGITLPSITLCKSTRLWLREQSSEHDALRLYLDLLEFMEGKESGVEQQMRAAAEQSSEAQLLMTIPGIATIRAIDLVAEIGEISRFPSASKLCSYAGLVPSVHQSGSTLHFGRLIQQSSKTLKYTLVETSWNLVRTKESNPLKEFYKKLSTKKGKQKAICAVARKLCCIVHTMLRKREVWRYSQSYDKDERRTLGILWLFEAVTEIRASSQK